MKGDKWLKEKFERELEILRDYFPNNSKHLEIAEDDGPMSWEEAMSEPLYYEIDLEVGGEMKMKINHDKKEYNLFGGEKVMK